MAKVEAAQSILSIAEDSNRTSALSAGGASTLPLSSSASSSFGAPSSSGTRQTRDKLIKSLDRIPIFGDEEVFDKDLFVCSEFERAANILSIAQSELTKLSDHLAAQGNLHTELNFDDNMKLIPSSKSAGSGDNNFSKVSELLAVKKSLDVTVQSLMDTLTRKISSYLVNLFTAAETSKQSQLDNRSAEIMDRRLSHCLRALSYMRKGGVAEEALVSSVIAPLIK